MPGYGTSSVDVVNDPYGVAVAQPAQTVEVQEETEVPDPFRPLVRPASSEGTPEQGEAMPEGYYTWKRFPCRAYTESEEKRVKMPLVNRWQTVATNDACQLAQWVKENDCIMWGFPTGMANGFWVVDLDRGHSEGVDGVENFKRYCIEHGYEFPQTLTVRTAGGGSHLYFRMPSDGVDIRNRQGASCPLPGVETRGTGGYVIGPSSVNLDIGKAYKWEDPSQKIAEAPSWLLELVTRKKEVEPVRTATPGAGMLAGGGGTAYGRKALADELEVVRNAPKGARNSTLNTAVFKIAGLVKSGELKDGNAVWSAFEEAARETGLSSGEIQATMKSAWSKAEPRSAPVKPGSGAAVTAGMNDEPKPGEDGFEFSEPVSFSAMSLPKMTPDMLPPVLDEYCAALAEAKQVPLELAASMSLAALSTAAVAGYEVEIQSGYREPLILYTLCPLEPANRKSAVCSAVMEPLIEWEKAMAEQLGPEIKKANSQRKSLEKAIDHKRTEFARAEKEDRDRIQGEIDELEAQMPEEIYPPRLLTDSVTPEALAALMAEQGECMAILSAEGGIFDILAGMYNRGVPNMDLFLKAWCRESYRVDRRHSESILLEHPALVMGLTTQPFTMVNRAASKAFRGRGLDGRFLYFLPESILGRRKVEPEPMNEAVKNLFNSTLKALLPTSWGKDRPQPQTLELSEEAYRAWLDFSGELEKELAEDGEFDGMTDWGGKLAGYVARLAGLFHLVSQAEPWRKKIMRETMELACQMGAFLTEHAKAAYALMGTDETLEGAKKVHGWIQRKHAGRFTTQEVWQALRGTFHHMQQLKEALAELTERFYIYEIPAEDRPGPGQKPAASYLVNPKALKG